MTRTITAFLLLFFSALCLGQPTGGNDLVKVNDTPNLNIDQRVLWYQKAQTKIDEENFEVARAYFTVAIELDGSYAQAYYGRGLAKAALGDYLDAIKDYDKAIELDPNFVDAHIARSESNAARNNFDAAMEDLSEAIAENPNSKEALHTKGKLQLKLGDYQGALSSFDDALSLDDQYAAAFNDRAKAKAAVGQYDDAVKDFKKAMILDPSYKDVYYADNSAKILEDENTPALKMQTAYVIGLLKASYNDHESAIETYTQILT